MAEARRYNRNKLQGFIGKKRRNIQLHRKMYLLKRKVIPELLQHHRQKDYLLQIKQRARQTARLYFNFVGANLRVRP